ncbi:MAG TPA: CehA/McbA family metallohydrolase [Gemmataceae bacterium]|nr:CehA/McbA family metallohydrolase [Gemmataceae bacterium]
MSAAWPSVHVRVNDAATGQPTPVRIRFTNPAGEYFAPLGRLEKFATGPNEDVGGNLLLGSRRYAYIDGTCEIRLPPGPILVEIHKGPEYQPRVLQATLKPGQLALRTTIERWVNLRQHGWYSGDLRSHFLTPHAALLEAAAEDLAVVNLLIISDAPGAAVRSEDGESFPVIANILAFSGQRPALEMPGHMVVVNTYNHHVPLGNLALLNCHRIIYPLYADRILGSPDWTLADWCDQCHRKGGLVVGTEDLARDRIRAEAGCGEMLAEVILGKIDAVELPVLRSLREFAQADWYSLLNIGCRLPLVGSSAKSSNAQVLGSWRSYVRLRPDQGFTYRDWIEAIRAGRTFLTNGPMLSLSVNGQDPGAILDLPSLDQPVQIMAEVQSWVPVDTLELILNGEVYRQVPVSGSPATARLELDTKLPAAGWLALRCSGPCVDPENKLSVCFGAHTSPIYVQVGGRPPPPGARSLADILDLLDQMLARVGGEKQAREGGMRHLVEILERARRLLAERRQA